MRTITNKITVQEYLENKGRLDRNETIYDSKGYFYGHFNCYNLENFTDIWVTRFDGVQVNCKRHEIMVEIEYTPIYEAI